MPGGITSIDPLRYDLLFERFLNPERVSMPDIDLDFCFENVIVLSNISLKNMDLIRYRRLLPLVPWRLGPPFVM